jgi:hypothetical protein
MAERRPLVFCVMPGVTLSARMSAANEAAPYPVNECATISYQRFRDGT